MLEFSANSRNVRLIKKLDISEALEIYSDKKRLKQVILNLVSNAIKFTTNGTITIKGKLIRDDS